MKAHTITARALSRHALPFLALLMLLCLLPLHASRAGGSIGWADASAQVKQDDPFLAAYIAEHFEVSPGGSALRVGHDSQGNSTVPGVGIGTRIPPFEFYAKPRGAAGPYTLCITLEPSNIDDGDHKLWTLTVRKKRDSE